MKYETWEELFDAYRSGELDPKEHILQMDNDDTFLFIDDVQVFQGGGYADIVDICNAAGIPTEWC